MAYIPNPWATSPDQTQEDFAQSITNRRLDNASAFRKYVQAKTDAGEKVDPNELNQTRLMMSAGDPYAASFIPAGSALQELTDRANDQSNKSRISLSADTLGLQKKKDDFVGQLAYDNADADPNEFHSRLEKQLGPETAGLLKSQYGNQYQGLLQEGSAKRLSELMQSEQFKNIESEKDIPLWYPNATSAQVSVLKRGIQMKQRALAEQSRKAVREGASIMPPDILDRSPEEQMRIARAIDPARPEQLLAISRATDVAGNVSENKAAIAKLSFSPEGQQLLAAASETGDDESLLNALNTLGGHFTKDSPEFKAAKAQLATNNSANAAIKWDAQKDTFLVQAQKLTEMQNKNNIESKLPYAATAIVAAKESITDPKNRKIAEENTQKVLAAVFGAKDAPTSIPANSENIAIATKALQSDEYDPMAPTAEVAGAISSLLLKSGKTAADDYNDTATELTEQKYGIRPQSISTFSSTKLDKAGRYVDEVKTQMDTIKKSKDSDVVKADKMSKLKQAALNIMQESSRKFDASIPRLYGLSDGAIANHRNALQYMIEQLQEIPVIIPPSKPGDVSGNFRESLDYAGNQKVKDTEASVERVAQLKMASSEIESLASQIVEVVPPPPFGGANAIEHYQAKISGAMAAAENEIYQKYGKYISSNEGQARSIIRTQIDSSIQQRRYMSFK